MHHNITRNCVQIIVQFAWYRNSWTKAPVSQNSTGHDDLQMFCKRWSSSNVFMLGMTTVKRSRSTPEVMTQVCLRTSSAPSSSLFSSLFPLHLDFLSMCTNPSAKVHGLQWGGRLWEGKRLRKKITCNNLVSQELLKYTKVFTGSWYARIKGLVIEYS